MAATLSSSRRHLRDAGVSQHNPPAQPQRLSLWGPWRQGWRCETSGAEGVAPCSAGEAWLSRLGVARRAMLVHVAISLIVVASLVFSTSAAATLTATGYGSSEREARSQALQGLSQNIATEIEGEIEVRTTIDADGAREEMDERIAARSAGYFEGVEYSEAEQVNGEKRVEARLSQDALLQTLRQLRRSADRELDAMSNHEIGELIDRADFGIALAGYARGGQRTQAEEIAAELEEKRAAAMRFLDFGHLTFDIQPDQAQILLEGERIDNRQRQLLPPGVYRYRIEADGYRTETASLRLSAHSNETISFAMVPDVAASVRLEGTDCCPRAARRALGEYGISVDDNSAVTLRFTFNQEHLAEIGGQSYYRLQAEVEGLYEGQVMASNRATLRRVAEGQLDSRSTALVEALTRAIISGEDGKAMLSKASAE
ncbi:carboxypeptidase-like regulatory domain-containing protein [Halorhodospira halochloris]|uniref:carboxypeptidase-like regulatory domain-containing protein n=1 Tax=Halorhodospira halochloris TaxID=1052 RepID=UPI001EE8D20C|nr:carboxypeptidase-like regulatory domain-containing protein [Halorhodospira halochloris]MCG5548886.1 carboxypeptidase-like regulatory domain-containing protein [Halorhodospira halochloris]